MQKHMCMYHFVSVANHMHYIITHPAAYAIHMTILYQLIIDCALHEFELHCVTNTCQMYYSILLCLILYILYCMVNIILYICFPFVQSCFTYCHIISYVFYIYIYIHLYIYIYVHIYIYMHTYS